MSPFNDFFFEYLQKGTDGMVAEIPSHRKNFRRWVYICVHRKCSITDGFTFPDNRFAHGPLYWFMDVFDFDHVTNDFKDYRKDEDCGITQRKYIERIRTTNLEEFKKKLEEYSLKQDMFTFGNPDFPQ